MTGRAIVVLSGCEIALHQSYFWSEEFQCRSDTTSAWGSASLRHSSSLSRTTPDQGVRCGERQRAFFITVASSRRRQRKNQDQDQAKNLS